MKVGREYDETELWDSGKFFTLEELMSETEFKERETDGKTLSEADRKSLLHEIHGELLTESERDDLVGDCIAKLSSKSVGMLTKKESEKLSIDVDEVHRLYFDENWTMKDIADQYGFKTSGPILRIFRKHGWKSKPQSTLEIEVNPEEVHRLYFEEGLILKEVAVRMGYKSQSPIRRIFKEQGWETKKKWRNLDYDKVYELYFERKMSLQKVAKEMELSSHYPIVCIFEEQGWKTRSPSGRRVEIDLHEVYKMYYEDRMTMREISEHFGYKGNSTITAIFREQGWNSRRMETVDMDIDSVRVIELYFEQKLPLAEVGRRVGKTRYALLKLFEKMDWRLRGSKCDSIEEKEERKREAQRRHQVKVNELKDEIFGTECEICGEEREIIHRKDGKRHSIYLTNSLKGLRGVNPNEWAPVCKPCHLDVHALMRVKTFEWNRIKEFLRDASQVTDA
jgi:AraC-like DNA-binding protein